MTQNRPGSSNGQMDRRYIHHLLKYGRQEEIRQMVSQHIREAYPDSFVPFMDQMIREHRVSRKDVAVRSGLSQDYVYKLLRGDKRTEERDYILAMCFAIGMNLPQTQHALSSYGMPPLSERDLRSHIIILAIRDGCSMSRLDAMLENAGFPLLRTRPDMPRAIITDTVPTEESAAVREPAGARRVFEEIDSFVDGQHNGGNAPFDYDYTGWIKLQDPEGQVYYAEAVYMTDFTGFSVYTEAQWEEAEKRWKAFSENRAEGEGGKTGGREQSGLPSEPLCPLAAFPDADRLEFYETLEDAAASEFFPFFLEIDRRTDRKVQEVLQKLDDTRAFGTRIGAGWHVQARIYVEAFNTNQPELREYYQIMEYRDGTCRYTATHESCFMQMELGQELYEAIFGPKCEPEFFIDTDRIEFCGWQQQYRFVFNYLKAKLDEYALANFPGMIHLDPAAVSRERVTVLIESGVLSNRSGQADAASDAFRQALSVLESLGASSRDHLAVYVCTCYKLACTLGGMGNPEAEAWWDRICALKEKVKEASDAHPEDFRSASGCVADALIHRFQKTGPAGKAARQSIQEAVQLIEQDRIEEDDWVTKFTAYCHRSFITEDENLEASLRDYRKSLAIARDHHLDQNPRCARSVAVQYNNYAWVLWNRLGSEESILYYGRALDLLESYMSSGVLDRETLDQELKRVGNALNRIYAATGREREADSLRRRLAEDGVILEK